MADKRRSSRIQGGWASKAKLEPTIAKRGKANSEDSGGRSGPHSSNFVFNPTVKATKAVKADRVIDTNGEFEISIGPTGISRVQLIKGFIPADECEWMFEQLKNEVPWKQQEIMVWGKKCLQPRLTAWYGDFPYTYSRLTLKPFQWSPLLNILRQKIEDETGYSFNSMLANLYRDNKDSVDWHSDDEKSLGTDPIIASLSFGDPRMFEMRRKPAEGVKESGTTQKIKIPLSNGSLLIMKGATQHDWQHRVPKEYHDRSPRINLTFRTIHQK